MVVAPQHGTQNAKTNEGQPKRYMTTDEAATAFGVTPAAMRRYARENVIPSYKLGGRVLFKLDEVEEAIRK